MGVCCTGDTNIENSILAQMDLMKIRSFPLLDVKSILYANNTSINGFEINKLSEESLTLYKRTLKTISYESFIKLSSGNFHNPLDAFQSSYFKSIHQASKSSRSMVFLYLIPLTKDTDDEKMKYFIDSFFSLNNQTEKKYYDIKGVMTDYIKCTLTIPFLSIKNTYEDMATKESIDQILSILYNDKNINQFVEYLFESFERRINAENENGDDEEEESKILSWSEVYFKETIETYKSFLFDFQLLNEAFNKKLANK